METQLKWEEEWEQSIDRSWVYCGSSSSCVSSWGGGELGWCAYYPTAQPPCIVDYHKKTTECITFATIKLNVFLSEVWDTCASCWFFFHLGSQMLLQPVKEKVNLSTCAGVLEF